MKTGIIPRVVIVALLTLLASGHALAQLTVTSEISDVRMASDSNPTVFELRLSITAGSDLSGSTFSVNLGDASFTAISSGNNGACGSPTIATPAGGITANAIDTTALTACTFEFEVNVPAGTASGTYNGSWAFNSNPADTFDIHVGQFSAQFFPTLRFVNTPFRLSLNIENQSDVNINDIAFDEAIPAGLVADPSSALTDSGCNGSPAFAAAANYTVSGSHSANTPINCAVDLQFSSASVGSYTWADLNLRHTSTALAPVSGLNPVTISSGLTSSNTLNVIDRPTINMSFAPDNIAPGETTTLTMTIENTSAENIPNFSAVLPIGQPFTRVADNGVNCPAYVVTPNGTNLEIEVNPLSSGATCSLTIELQIDGPVAGPTLSTNTMTASPGDIPPVSANLIVRAASAAQVAVPTLGAWQWLLGAALFGIVVRLRRKK